MSATTIYRVQQCSTNDTLYLTVGSAIGVTLPLTVGTVYEFTTAFFGSDLGCAKVLEVGSDCADVPGVPTFPNPNFTENLTLIKLNVSQTRACDDADCASYTTGDCGADACPPGTTLFEDRCQIIAETAGQVVPDLIPVQPGSQNTDNGSSGTRIYTSIALLTYPPAFSGDAVDGILENDGGDLTFQLINDPANTLWVNSTPSTVTKGRLNRVGAAGGPASNGKWIGFTVCIDAPNSKTYCVGIGGNDKIKLKLNGDTVAAWNVANPSVYEYWHILEFTLNKGLNIVEFLFYNDGGAHAYGGEIYDANVLTLLGLTSEAALAPYIVWNTKEEVGQSNNYFTSGETVGNVCPEGFSYDHCSGTPSPFYQAIRCINIRYLDLVSVECCWLIENCRDSGEVYLIKLSEEYLFTNSDSLYLDGAYEFFGDDRFINKCFKVLSRELCDQVDIDTAAPLAYHTTCDDCRGFRNFESCDNPGEITKITFFNQSVPLIVDNIYEIRGLKGCYKYKSSEKGFGADVSGTSIIADRGPVQCPVCDNCLRFKNCDTDVEIVVSLTSTVQSLLSLGIYELGGDPALEDVCWQFLDYEACTGSEDYTDVTITEDLSCATCDVCIPVYTLRSCEGNQLLQIQWAKSAPPLDEDKTYIFDFAPDTCYNVQLDFSPCDAQAQPFEFNKACAYTFVEKLDFIEDLMLPMTEIISGVGEILPTVFRYTIPSLIINDIEYVTGLQPFWEIDWALNGGSDINTVPATNGYGYTYTDQVDGLNAAFVELGIDHLIKAQVCRDDAAAGLGGFGLDNADENLIEAGGYFLITREDVFTFSIDMDDDNGYIRQVTHNNHRNIVTYGTNSQGEPFSRELPCCGRLLLKYEFMTCEDIQGNPFVVTNGIVEEPNAPE